ncbi:MAG: polysaccharide biosynthesis/export family protein [Candidatus Omnitrophica bacterium]|nr:polysaccharide biosynthesis/export family protein [Candidatus Omnitrophota bacterium]
MNKNLINNLSSYIILPVYIVTFLLFQCGTAFSEERSIPLEEYRLGPENVLVIEVYFGKDETINKKVRVTAKGMITFPLLGEVPVSGLTISELESKLTYLLEKDYLVNPQVSVFIEEYSTVSILGQVEHPGSFSIKGRLSVVELISLAGGFTKIAAKNNVRILRKTPDGAQKTIIVNVNDIINKGIEGEDIMLEPGDIVTVPESFF